MTFYIPYFQPQVMVKFTRRVRGHFVTLTEICMHLIEHSPGVISRKRSHNTSSEDLLRSKGT